MPSEKPITPDDSEPRKAGISFLKLALILIIGLTVTSIMMILAIFFLSDRNGSVKDVNVNITLPSSTPYTPDKPIIRQAPPQPSPPKVGQRPKYSMPVPPASPTPAKNGNEQLTPKPPSPSSPSESPP